MKIHVLRGLPASGKTTFARKFCKKTGAKRINKDDLRAMLDDGKYSLENETLVLKARNFLAAVILHEGFDVVIDDTNLNPRHLEGLQELAEEVGAELLVMDMDVSLDECIRRDSLREKPVGEQAIREMHQKHLAPKGNGR